MAASHTAPFKGITVVEFGQFVAVPFAAQLLAEGGAHVIKIEAVDGEPTRRLNEIAPLESRTYISRNRGKHVLPLALGQDDVQPVLDALFEQADVVLMNFRPGLAEKLGLAPADLHARYPRLIIGNVSAFGTTGPDASLPGMDIVVQARSGLMAANGRLIDGRPAPGDPVSADYMCAMSLSFGIASALYRREQTGVGGIVETSLMQAAMTLANNQFTRSETIDAPEHARQLTALADQRAQHASFAEQAAALPSVRALPLLKVYFRTYETADATIAVACVSQKLRTAFAAAIGLEDAGLSARDPMPPGYYDDLQTRAEATMRTRPAAHWEAVLKAEGLPVAAVRFPVELFDDPHVAANAMLHHLDHPVAGPMTVVSPPVAIDGDGFAPAPATAAFASETRQLLSELGFDDAAISTLLALRMTTAE